MQPTGGQVDIRMVTEYMPQAGERTKQKLKCGYIQRQSLGICTFDFTRDAR